MLQVIKIESNQKPLFDMRLGYRSVGEGLTSD